MYNEDYHWTPDKMLEVTFEESDQFLKIKETLTRIGVASSVSKTLFQSAHILHKKGRYYIMSFKELFCLDGKPTNLVLDDIARRNTIAMLLESWGLLKIVDTDMIVATCNTDQLKIIQFKDKKDWELVPKYTVGSNKQLDNQR